MIRFFFVLAMVVGSTAISIAKVGKEGGPIILDVNQVKYQYLSYDGALTASCKHVLENLENPYDWTVKCTDQKGGDHRFNVHLAVSRFRHPAPPEVTYEVLYWVNGNGASSLYDFKKDGELMKISSGQSVTGEDAELRLDLNLGSR
jgi:hypothetical protein